MPPHLLGNKDKTMNMKAFKSSFILFCLTVFILSGCSYRVLDFTIISSKNINLAKGASFVRGKSRVKGKDMVHWVICFPIGAVHVKDALDKAIESTPGCVALLDGVIYEKFWWIPYIYGQQSVVVEGLPIIDPSLVLNTEKTPTYGKIELDKNGMIEKIERLSSNEYRVLKGSIIKESQVIIFKDSEEIK